MFFFARQAVVNDQLQVLGIPNVRIVDASIMPTITSGNTNSPVIAIAEKACEMMLAGAAGGVGGRAGEVWRGEEENE